MVAGTLTNKSSLPVTRIRVAIDFLDSKDEVLSSAEAAVVSDQPLDSNQEAAFSIRGRDLLGKVATVSYEITDFKVIVPPAAPGTEEQPPAPTK